MPFNAAVGKFIYVLLEVSQQVDAHQMVFSRKSFCGLTTHRAIAHFNCLRDYEWFERVSLNLLIIDWSNERIVELI